MDSSAIAQELRARSRRLRNPDDEPSNRGQLADDGELLLVLARIVNGTPIERAFGAPGDWGYEHPIGRALAAKGGQ